MELDASNMYESSVAHVSLATEEESLGDGLVGSDAPVAGDGEEDNQEYTDVLDEQGSGSRSWSVWVEVGGDQLLKTDSDCAAEVPTSPPP
ncbi:unnamed protein product [Cuscuta europaea]|uniref:Uncharacterized protein n=1 Tax=Cuscuta europaea TaxID=41803 RepID=A0A9P0YTJ5_CUSEU|nr:unnamed protein product [Cuscuta europaea]